MDGLSPAMFELIFSFLKCISLELFSQLEISSYVDGYSISTLREENIFRYWAKFFQAMCYRYAVLSFNSAVFEQFSTILILKIFFSSRRSMALWNWFNWP